MLCSGEEANLGKCDFVSNPVRQQCDPSVHGVLLGKEKSKETFDRSRRNFKKPKETFTSEKNGTFRPSLKL